MHISTEALRSNSRSKICRRGSCLREKMSRYKKAKDDENRIMCVCQGSRHGNTARTSGSPVRDMPAARFFTQKAQTTEYVRRLRFYSDSGAVFAPASELILRSQEFVCLRIRSSNPPQNHRLPSSSSDGKSVDPKDPDSESRHVRPPLRFYAPAPPF